MKEIVCSGALFYSLATERFLFLHRTGNKSNVSWGLVGGTNELKETPWEGLKREIQEEIGNVEYKKVVPLESFVSNDNHFFFHTYLIVVDNEFIPTLNNEHDGYAWVSSAKWPKPLHHGLRNTLQNKTIQNKLSTIVEVLKVIDINE
tara:strand:- start:8273 stop:8713 length:441 start_codon:yes stop_codon:yes gene_type:complete